MKRTAIVTAAGIAFAAALSPTPASAQFFRTFVFGTGSDGNPCTRTQPCLTFQRAHDNTFAGGEIDVLDPGGYGLFTITKAISIVNDGVGTVGIRALSGGNAITVNVGPSDNVSLRGLTIEGAGVGSNGIVFGAGKSLSIDRCAVRNFLGVGIRIEPSTSGNFSITNTFVTDNSDTGIVVEPVGSAVVAGTMDNVQANNNISFGIGLFGENTTGASLNVTVLNSVASNNSTGIFAQTAGGHAAISLQVRNSVVSYNGNAGLEAGLGTGIRLGHSVITGNAFGFLSTPTCCTIQSYGDNDIDGNSNDNTGALGPIVTH